MHRRLGLDIRRAAAYIFPFMPRELSYKNFFARDTVEVARDLLGKKLAYGNCSGVIVETEAYKEDAASHAVTRPNKGTMLRETYGCVYIYFIYGMYHCLNFTTEKQGVGAVLIRAIEPVSGVPEMQERRSVRTMRQLTNGPGKLFLAFGLDPALHGEEVGRTIKLEPCRDAGAFEIGESRRIGISKAKGLEWRFFIKENEFLSKR